MLFLKLTIYDLYDLQDLVEGSVLDFYYKGSLICWADHGQETIQCVTFNGTHAGNKVPMVDLI